MNIIKFWQNIRYSVVTRTSEQMEQPNHTGCTYLFLKIFYSQWYRYYFSMNKSSVKFFLHEEKKNMKILQIYVF